MICAVVLSNSDFVLQVIMCVKKHFQLEKIGCESASMPLTVQVPTKHGDLYSLENLKKPKINPPGTLKVF